MIFLVKDKSGRGMSVECDKKHIHRHFVGERDYNGVSARTFAKVAEVGDVWQNATLKITAIRQTVEQPYLLLLADVGEDSGQMVITHYSRHIKGLTKDERKSLRKGAKDIRYKHSVIALQERCTIHMHGTIYRMKIERNGDIIAWR